jgi:hypothetical protein
MKRIFIIFVWVTLFSLTGCSVFPSYNTYTPPENSLLSIEFDYPIDWSWDVNAKDYIIASDPDGNGDFGVFVYEKETLHEITNEMNEDLQATFLYGADRDAYITFEPVEINDYPAKHITLNLPAYPRQGQEKPWIQETYYLLIGNRLHEISINIDKDQRNGAFGRGFDHVIKTIRVIGASSAP